MHRIMMSSNSNTFWIGTFAFPVFVRNFYSQFKEEFSCLIFLHFADAVTLLQVNNCNANIYICVGITKQ